MFPAFSAPKRRVFVSYHHGGDQVYADAFCGYFCDQLELFCDTSLERGYDSDDHDYLRWAIKQRNISGSSCTIVLCGVQTRWRKFVDWEIKATLDLKHGLLGVWLPSNPQASNGGVHKPDRLQDNIASGFSEFIAWDQCTAMGLKSAIERAVRRSRALINNHRALRQRNG
jgi:hypothetical protein